MKIEIRLPFTSRFKKTIPYTEQGRTYFGLWKKPDIILEGDEKVITISSDQEGQLDLIAEKEYDDRSLFWAIASVNGIRSVTDEVVSGLKIIIPHLENIRVALLDSSENE